jgi:hypothetical protein
MNVRRVAAPAHYQCATSFEIIGPTSDGLLHMHFFREGMIVHGETGDVVAQNERRVELRNLRQSDGSPEHVRVEVAVISFPVGKLADFARTLALQQAQLEAQQRATEDKGSSTVQ